MLYLLFDLLTIAYANHPNIFNGIQIVPLEDNSLKRQSVSILQEREQIQHQLWSLVQEGIITNIQLSRLTNLSYYSETISNREFENFLRTFETQETEDMFSISGIRIPTQARPRPIRTPPTTEQAEAQMLMRHWIDTGETIFSGGSLFQERDRHAIQSILNQSAMV